MEQWPQVDLHSLVELTWIIKKTNNIDIFNTSSKNVITTRKRPRWSALPLPKIFIISQTLPHTSSQAQISSIQVWQYGDAQFRWQHLQVYKTMWFLTYQKKERQNRQTYLDLVVAFFCIWLHCVLLEHMSCEIDEDIFIICSVFRFAYIFLSCSVFRPWGQLRDPSTRTSKYKLTCSTVLLLCSDFKYMLKKLIY